MSAQAAMERMNRSAETKVADSAWRRVYLVGGVAALIAVVIFRRNLGAEVSLLTGQMPPVTAGDWFTLLRNDSLLGITLLGFFDVVNAALVGLMILAVCPVLKRVNESAMLVAVSLGLIGVAVYAASNQALSMLSLSHQFVTATTDVQQVGFLAAGEALLAINSSGTGSYLSLLLVTLAGLMISLVMLRSGIFSRFSAYAGILGNTLVLGYFVVLMFAPSLTFLPHTMAAIPLIVWQFLIARKLFQLGRADSKTLA